MEKQYNSPAVLKATEKVNKLLSFLLSNSEAGEDWVEIEWADSYYFVSSTGRVLSLCNKLPYFMKPFMCTSCSLSVSQRKSDHTHFFPYFRAITNHVVPW